MKRSLCLIIISLLFYSNLLAQAAEIEQIRVNSSWGGLGNPGKDELIIVAKKDAFFAGGRKIENRLVEALLSAVDEATIDKPSLANLGVTRRWLEDNAQQSIDEYAKVYFDMGADNQRQLFLSSFKDIEIAGKVVPELLTGGWTDDYPHASVTITKKNGETILVNSDMQPGWMLPWSIKRDGKVSVTYNAHISMALAAVLPVTFPNRERIAGQDFRRRLAAAVMDYVEEDWKRLEVENKAKGPLDILKRDYTILSTEINPYHGWDFGLPANQKGPTEKNLHALLRAESFPKNFSIKVILPFFDGNVHNLDLFQKKIADYEALIDSVPWLKEAIRNGSSEVWLRFVNDRSFSDRAMETFAADMKKIGKESLIPEVEQSKEKIALISVGGGLEYYQSYLLVMPDGKVILWSGASRGNRSLLIEHANEFMSQECSDPRSNTKPCIGAVISREGEIISK